MIAANIANLVTLAVALGLGLPNDDNELTAQAVVDRAVKAMGGRDKLDKVKAVRWDAWEVWFGENTAIGSLTKNAAEFPNKYRIDYLYENRRDLAIVVNGQETWMERDGKVIEQFKNAKTMQGIGEKVTEPGVNATKSQGKEGGKKEQAWLHHWLYFQLVLAHDKRVKLKLIGKAQVKQRGVMVCSVTHPDYVELRLFFDNENGLLVKSSSAFFDPIRGKEAVWEEFYYDYKKTNGILLPRRGDGWADGKRRFSYGVTEVELLEQRLKIELFQKP